MKNEKEKTIELLGNLQCSYIHLSRILHNRRSFDTMTMMMMMTTTTMLTWNLYEE